MATPNGWSVAQVADFRQTLDVKLRAYTAGSVEEFSDESDAFLHFVRLLVNEAEALAWSTPYPHLLLPALVEEKIQYARHWGSRQSWIGNGLGAASAASRCGTGKP